MNAAQYTIENNGGTFRASDLAPVQPVRGYAVGVCRGTALKVPTRVPHARAHFVPGDIQNGIESVCNAYGTPYVGTWVEDGIVYIDPVVILPDYGSAVILGRAFGQQAIYSFSTDRVISLGTEPSDDYWLGKPEAVLPEIPEV